MTHIPDILLVAVFACLAFRGWRRGFMRSVLGVARLVLSFLVTVTLGATVGQTFVTGSPVSVVIGAIVG